MPYYEYRCPTNGRTVEVRHGMSQTIATWGELRERAGVDSGSTPDEAPVERILSVPAPVPGRRAAAPVEGCGAGCACAMDA